MTKTKPFPWGSPSACLRIAVVCLLPVLLATCGEDGPSGPSGSPMVGRVEFTHGPITSSGFFGPNLPIDRVHVLIVRPPSAVVKDTTRAFDPNLNQIRLDLPILLRAAAESLDVTLELLSGTTVLFSGTSRLEAHAGPPSSSPPPAIPLIYSGPGSQIAQLVIDPPDSTVSQGDSLVMRVTGLDNAQLPISAFYVGWSSSDTTIARVNGAGVVRGRVPRGTVYIRAKTPDTQSFPAGIVESTTVTLVPAPATLIKVAGDNQSAPINSPLPLMLEVEVRAQDNLPIAGVPVTFATVSPGATVDSAIATTDANGIARTGATLGSTVGAQSFTATATGAPPVTFTANAAAAPAPTWTGAVSTDWHDPNNWNLGFVPASADSVTIPAAPANQPLVAGTNATTGALLNNGTISLGSTIAITSFGNVRGSGTIAGTGNAVLVMPLAGSTLDLSSVPNLSVSAAVSLGRTVNITGQLNVLGSGDLIFANHTANVGSSFSTTGTATITMTGAIDSLKVQGNVLFDGGSTFGKISSGAIFVRGNFTQAATSSSRSYAPTGNHIDVFNGTGVQTVTFATPGAAGSNFETLALANIAGGVTIASDLFLSGPVGFAAGVPRIAHGTGQTLFVAELLANNVTLDNILVVANNVLITQFDSVNFINYSSSATPLTISHPGAATPFVFNDVTFGVTPTSGFYIRVTDLAADANVLTINMVNPTPATGAPFIQTVGGAVVNWPSLPTGLRTWNGAVSNDWSNSANWTPATVPTSLDDVLIPGGTPNNPTITSSCAAKSIQVNSGGAISLGAFNCQVQGDVLVSGGINATTGAIQIQAAGQISGNLPGLIINAPVTVASATGLGSGNGNILISGATASLIMNGQTLSTPGTLTVQNGGLLVMTNAADALNVSGDVVFDGGNELGQLTAGILTLAGDFTQNATSSANSFVAGVAHQTVLVGSLNQAISFASPSTSGFQNLVHSGVGPVSFATDARAFGTVIWLGGVTVNGAGHTFTVQGIAADGPTFDNLLLRVNSSSSASALALNNLTFQNYAATATQVGITHPGSTPVTWDGLTFSTTPTAGGFYLSATDQNPSDGTPLTIDVTNSSPANGAPFIQTAAGAVVNWPAGGPQTLVLWTGAVSTDWSNPANWSPNQVPTFSDSVEIPAGGNQPSLTAQSFAGALRLANGTLTINGQQLAVVGNFYSTGSGRLVMTNALDIVSIGGDAHFDGANELGFMSAGNLILGGDLIQTASTSPDSYHPSGTHTTLFNGSATQTISFATPGLVPGSSHLQEVTWAGLADLVMTSDVSAHGTFTAAASTARTINSNSGHLLTVGGWISAIGAVTFDGARLLIDQTTPSVLSLNNLTFDNQIATAVQLEVRSPGSGGTETFTNLTFTTTPTSGLYLRAVDNLADANVLTIDMVNPSPGTDGGFSQVQGGAVITWPAAGGGGTSTWTGAADDDWNNPANWQGGSIPGPSDDVIIPAGMPNYPSLTSNEEVNDLEVESGATIVFIDGFLEVTGNLTGGGSMTGSGPEMSGTGVVLEMADVGTLLVTGFVTLNSDLLVTSGDVAVIGAAAHFDINGFDLAVTNGGFNTASLGTFQMTNPSGSMDIAGDVVFEGGPENGLLTQGTMTVKGNFTQGNSSSQNSFRSGGMLVILDGTSQQVVTFSDSLLSFFDDLDLDNTGGGILMASLVRLNGDLAIASGVNVTAVDATVNGDGLDVLGDVFASGNLAVGRLYLVGNLSMTGTWSTASVIFQGTGQTAPILPYNAVFVQVGSVTFANGPVSMNTLTVSSGTLNLNGRTTVGAAGVFITGGTLDPSNNTLNILGALNLSGTGTLTMQNPLDSVITGATGAAIFGGGSTAGLMTDGVLKVGGSFSQTSGISTLSFAPSGNHKTVLGSGAVRVVNFASPGTGATGSHFANLDVTAGSGGISLVNNIVVDGALISAPTGLTPTLTSGGKTVTAMSLAITTPLTTSLVFDDTPLIVNEQGTIRSQQFDKAQFIGFPSSATLLDMTMVGTTVTPRPVQFNNVSFQTSVTNLYARLVSSNTQFVTVTMQSSNDPTGGPSKSNPSFGTTVNGARIVWQ
jgi:hypothetical protein